MKDNQELHQERGVDCGCGDGSCGTEKQTAGVQEPETSGCSIREEVVDGLREREGKEKQEGQGGAGRGGAGSECKRSDRWRRGARRGRC